MGLSGCRRGHRGRRRGPPLTATAQQHTSEEEPGQDEGPSAQARHQPKLPARPFDGSPAQPQSWRQVPPSEQGGVLHRSSRPQQVWPAGRRDSLLSKWGVEKSLSVSGLPHSGQAGVIVVERTKTSTRPPHAAQRYS